MQMRTENPRKQLFQARKKLRSGEGNHHELRQNNLTAKLLFEANIVSTSGSRIQASRLASYPRTFATSTAASSWLSLPSAKASRERSTENLGTMPLFSSIRPCQVR